MLGPQNSEMPVTKEQREAGIKFLIQRWMTLLDSENPGVTWISECHKLRFSELLVESVVLGKELPIIAIGCQDWVKPAWGDPTRDRLLGLIDPKKRRGQRFVQEMTQLSSALQSLGVTHRFHFSLSDVEPLMHAELRNMDLEIHTHNVIEVMSANLGALTAAMKEEGVSVNAFSHAELLFRLLGATDIGQLQKMLLGNSPPIFRNLLDALYRTDLSVTAKSLVGENTTTPVWLNIQSTSFVEELTSFQQSAAVVAPDMPIVNLIQNAGNWHAQTQPSIRIPDQNDLVSNLVLRTVNPKQPNALFTAVHRSNDEVLAGMLREIGFQIESIGSANEKMIAVRLFMLSVCGIDPLAQTV